MSRLLPLIAAVSLLTFIPSGRADALPVFAHRYGLSCEACHTTVPHLNAFGLAFRAAGFRMPGTQRGALPVAVKVQLAYSSDKEDGLPKAIVDEVELLTGGAIGSKLNYFIEQYAVDGGAPGRTRDAWLQYNAGNNHLRAGRFTLPLPVDPEAERDTLAHYALYDQTVGENRFNFFDPRIGIDAFTENAGLSAHLVAAQSDAMAFLAKRKGTWTGYFYRYQGQRHIDGARDAFYRQGYGLGKDAGKLNVLAVFQNGNDSNANGGAAAFSTGNLLQLRYAFSDALTAIARHGRTFDPIGGRQQDTVLTLVTRPARNMRFTIEDRITDHHALNMGWLFAY